jgi:dienelactone hydrolase
MDITNFTVDTKTEKIECSLVSPKNPSKNAGILLNISATREYALHDPLQSTPTIPFLEAGHYVLSFDLAHHGSRIKYPDTEGKELKGMALALLDGNDPFEQFINDGKAALDWCKTQNIGTNGKTVAYGVSRGAYCCLRLAASDSRVYAIAGPSPVTTWHPVTEFSSTISQSLDLNKFDIQNWIDSLGEKAVYLSVGSQDDIVSTNACVDFAIKLFKHQKDVLPENILLNELHVVDSPSHSPSIKSRLDATRFLLEHVNPSKTNIQIKDELHKNKK